MKELIKTELKEAPVKVQEFFKELMEDDRLRFIEAYMGQPPSYRVVEVLVILFKVNKDLFFNEDTYFCRKDIIRVEVGIGEDFDNKYPILIEKIGEISGTWGREVDIDLSKEQMT